MDQNTVSIEDTIFSAGVGIGSTPFSLHGYNVSLAFLSLSLSSLCMEGRGFQSLY